MQFFYKAKKNTGEEVSGQMEASDRYELARALRKEGLTPFTISESGLKKSGLKMSFDSLASFYPIKLEEKVFLANNLAAMLSAGLSLSRALIALEKQSANPRLKKILTEISKAIDRGDSLSAAIQNYPKVFSPIFVSMVMVGENSGKLSESLAAVGSQLGKTYALRKKIKGAMVYPAIIIIAMILIGALMLIYIVPTLATTFKELNVPLPTSTKIIIGLSDFLVNRLATFLAILSGVIYVIYRFSRSEKGKLIFHKLFISVPLIGPIARKMNTALITRTLSTLVSSGMDLLGALEISGKVVQNVHYQRALLRAKDSIQKGSPLSNLFQTESKLFPVLAGEMMSVGEETGKLPEMLLKVAIFYEEEVDQVTKDLSTVVEPILMVVIGGAVGFFAVSMIQPIYSIGTGIK